MIFDHLAPGLSQWEESEKADNSREQCRKALAASGVRSHRTRFILPCIGCLVAGARRHSPTSATLTRIQVCGVTLCEFSDPFSQIDIRFDSCHFVDALRRNLTRTLGKISALRRAHSHHLILSDRQR